MLSLTRCLIYYQEQIKYLHDIYRHENLSPDLIQCTVLSTILRANGANTN
jgi:hypothetical protein